MTNTPFSVAIIDDDPMMCQLVEDLIGRKYPNAQALRYSTGEEALASGFTPDLVILDYQLDSVKPDALNGLQVLKKIKQRSEHTPVLFLSGQDRLEVATNTVKFGAYDYIVKNDTTFAKLENSINNILEVNSLKKTGKTQKMMNNLFWVLITTLFAYIVYLRLQS
jgi:two-component system, OmpR family, response regulator